MRTDEDLQRKLAHLLPPDDLATHSDAELEAMLEREATRPHAHGGAAWFGWAAAAAAVLVAAWVWSGMGVDGAAGAGDVVEAEGEGTIGGNGELPPGLPEHVGTPTPPVLPEEKWVKISPDYPKPVFVGIQPPIRRPNLDTRPRVELGFSAPEGTKLVSRGAKVSSSDPEPLIGDLEMVTDGDKEGLDGSYVELDAGRQWVQIDLGEPRQIWDIIVWHYHKGARAYDDVVVQLSDKADFKGVVRTAFNNDHDNSSGLGAGSDPAWVETNHGRIIEIGGVVARYVRLYSNGNTSNTFNHYVEVEVWGR